MALKKHLLLLLIYNLFDLLEMSFLYLTAPKLLNASIFE